MAYPSLDTLSNHSKRVIFWLITLNQNHQPTERNMFKFTKLTGAALTAVMMSSGLLPGVAQANDNEDYIYCTGRVYASNKVTVYFSGIFKGDYNNGAEYRRMVEGLRNYLENNRNVEIDYRSRNSFACYKANTFSAAEDSKSDKKSKERFALRSRDGETLINDVYWPQRYNW